MVDYYYNYSAKRKGADVMREYVIVRKPEVLDWDQIPAAPIDNVLWNMPAEGIDAMGQMCYDDKNLYVRLTTKEVHIKAQYTGELDFPNNDSCLEIYLCPMDGDNRYFNIEVNPNGLLLQGLGRSFWDLIRFKPLHPNIHPVSEYIEGGWRTTYSVPLEYFTEFFPGFEFKSGKTMHGNFYKCGDECVQPHYYSWSPITTDVPNFHYVPDFGLLRFE